jgi:PIN domain
MEVLQGARSKAEMRSIRSLFRETGVRILPITEQIGYSAAASIEEQAVSDGLRAVDALIAATALESGQVLATANDRLPVFERVDVLPGVLRLRGPFPGNATRPSCSGLVLFWQEDNQAYGTNRHFRRRLRL